MGRTDRPALARYGTKPGGATRKPGLLLRFVKVQAALSERQFDTYRGEDAHNVDQPYKSLGI
jgi:hypothetical protein